MRTLKSVLAAVTLPSVALVVAFIPAKAHAQG